MTLLKWKNDNLKNLKCELIISLVFSLLEYEEINFNYFFWQKNNWMPFLKLKTYLLQKNLKVICLKTLQYRKKFKQVKTTCKIEQSSKVFHRYFYSGFTNFQFYFEKFDCNFAILTLYYSKIYSNFFTLLRDVYTCFYL